MTTIAYDHKEKLLAIDGRLSADNKILQEDFQKWHKDDNDYWFFCGLNSDEQRMIDAFKSGDISDKNWDVEVSAFLVSDGEVYHCVIDDKGKPIKSLCTYNDALGTGADFALSAMDHGKTATDAVRYAMTRDMCSGGNITGFDVSRMEFIK